MHTPMGNASKARCHHSTVLTWALALNAHFLSPTNPQELVILRLSSSRKWVMHKDGQVVFSGTKNDA